MKKFIISALLFCSLLPLFAQGRFVKCNVKDGDNSIIKVSQSSEKTEILGNISRTTVELIITNSSNRILEGEFEFPLEKDETVTGFALDINGKMRQAVAIEKEKGRVVFEEIVRKNVDPGLLEMTTGNSFKTRVYPIPAKGFRQIQIVYEKKLPSTSFAVKKDTVFTETIGKDTYFYCYPDLSKLVNNNDILKKDLPASITIYYDVSSSAEKRDVSNELLLLREYLEKTKLNQFQVVTFSNKVHERKNLNSVAAVLNFLKEQTFDGGTNLNLDLSSEQSDQIILISDGIHNFDKAPEFIRRNSVRNKTIAINSASGCDFSTLNTLAAETIDLKTMSVEEGLNHLLYKTLRLLSVDYDETTFDYITPDSTYTSYVNDSFCISGVLSKKRGSIKLSFGYENNKVLLEKEIAVSSYETENCVNASGVNHLWATERITDLSKNYNANKDEIIALAKKYTVVTPDTSLIILETINDYYRYNITPPEELKEEYINRFGQTENIVKNNIQSGIPSSVYTEFKEYKAWWNKSPRDFKRTIRQKASNPPTYYDYESEEMLLETAPTMLNSNARTATVADESILTEQIVSFSKSEVASENGNSAESASVVLQAWSSNEEYLSILKKTPENKMYEKYLELKNDHRNSPSFYIEVADYFVEEGMKNEGLRILSNMAELNLENTDVLRALGNKLNEWKEYKLACIVFEKLVALKPEVPQFLRDLGLAYKNSGESQNAIETLWKLASHSWDSRYSQIQQTALNDMNSIIALSPKILDTSNMDQELLENFDVDIRVVLTWNTDDCDIDLWVTDPDNEKCFYGNRLTQNGGRMSRDFTQGYGPEEFAIKLAPKGKYKIQANYFANHQQKLLQPIIVQAEVYTNFGRPNQTCQIMTLQLDNVKGTFDIGEIRF